MKTFKELYNLVFSRINAILRYHTRRIKEDFSLAIEKYSGSDRSWFVDDRLGFVASVGDGLKFKSIVYYIDKVRLFFVLGSMRLYSLAPIKPEDNSENKPILETIENVKEVTKVAAKQGYTNGEIFCATIEIIAVTLLVWYIFDRINAPSPIPAPDIPIPIPAIPIPIPDIPIPIPAIPIPIPDIPIPVPAIPIPAPISYVPSGPIDLFERAVATADPTQIITVNRVHFTLNELHRLITTYFEVPIAPILRATLNPEYGTASDIFTNSICTLYRGAKLNYVATIFNHEMFMYKVMQAYTAISAVQGSQTANFILTGNQPQEMLAIVFLLADHQVIDCLPYVAVLACLPGTF